jgi:hypothetical protein
MEAASRLVRRAVSNRVVRCLWCHQGSSHADVIRNHGLCGACVEECVTISWRVIYDRERNIGSIPANLRVAYGL